MAHTKYTTLAWVVARAAAGESNVIVTLCTRDFGLVRAAARSVREQRSRLRYSLQTGTLADASLVKGRAQWRLVSAREQHRLAPHGSYGRTQVAKTLRLLHRMAPADEPNPALFGALTAALRESEVGHAPEAWSGIELLSAAAILAILGYLSPAQMPDGVELPSEANAFSFAAAREAHAHRLTLVAAINEAIAASHL